jgi:7-cyano-7-deazaguanine synthase in queuosine biosynthesis
MINISGGVDSVYAALKALESGERLLLHHCVLKSRTNRWQQEKKAVQHAVSYFRQRNLNGFTYVETSFDYGKINYLIYDVELIGFLTGLVLRNPRYESVNKVIVSVNKDDPTGQDRNTPRRVISNSLATTLLGDRKIEFVYPHIDMTKKDMLIGTPRPLLEKLWWCRTPRGGNACGTCRPCREINPILKKLT